MKELLELLKNGKFQVKGYSDREEYLSDTARTLYHEGIVTEGFEQVILKREREYPTGIVTSTIPVCIPHAEYGYVNRESMVFTIFEKPVLFQRMDNPGEEIPAELSFMLLLKDADSHLTILQQLVKLLQSPRLIGLKDVNSLEEFRRLAKEMGAC